MLEQLCQSYLDALNEGSLEQVLGLFTENGVVDSPLYGEMPATDFYKALFADTSKSETSLLNVFLPAQDGLSVALHFNYVWTLHSGKVVDFECVDVFHVNASKDKFTKLKIIYDTHMIRDEHSKSQRSS